ncbi:hypothetical protein ACTFIY_002487 [Dictyostelium cf. discoideum]
MVTTNINNNKSINKISKDITYFNNNNNNNNNNNIILLNGINNQQDRINQLRINDEFINNYHHTHQETINTRGRRFFKFLLKFNKKSGSNNDTIQVHFFTPYW